MCSSLGGSAADQKSYHNIFNDFQQVRMLGTSLKFCVYFFFTAIMAFQYDGFVKTSPENYLGFEASGQTNPDALIELVFRVKDSNQDKLLELLHASSDPTSPNYGHHMTKEAVDELTANEDGMRNTMAFLHAIPGLSITSPLTSKHIHCTASVESWNLALKADFHNFEKIDSEGKKLSVIRTHEYHLPNQLAEHVSSIQNTVEFPSKVHRGPGIIGGPGIVRGPHVVAGVGRPIQKE